MPLPFLIILAAAIAKCCQCYCWFSSAGDIATFAAAYAKPTAADGIAGAILTASADDPVGGPAKLTFEHRG